MFELRPYQKEAVERILKSKEERPEEADLVVMPTGSGKSLIVAEIAKGLGEPILIIQPSKEILEQNLEKLLQYVSKDDVGIYSASMNEKTIKKYTLATIASIYKKPELFAHFGTMIIDECHTVSAKNINGMFMKFIDEVNYLREKM